ncbi:hypothetical protein Tco_1012535, partial [Tanacetum coccineum]
EYVASESKTLADLYIARGTFALGSSTALSFPLYCKYCEEAESEANVRRSGSVVWAEEPQSIRMQVKMMMWNQGSYDASKALVKVLDGKIGLKGNIKNDNPNPDERTKGLYGPSWKVEELHWKD